MKVLQQRAPAMAPNSYNKAETLDCGCFLSPAPLTLSAAVNVVMNATTRSAAPLLCTESQSNIVKKRYGAGFVDTSTPNLHAPQG